MNSFEAQSVDLRLPTLNSPSVQQVASPLLKTILLAEDDDDLRYVMECVLTSIGYLVISCANAQIASSAFRSHSGVDILLTDFQMPGRSGIELARELTGLCPSLPVVIVSGCNLTTQTLQEIQDEQWTYVSKPCHLSSFEATLKRVLTVERLATIVAC